MPSSSYGSQGTPYNASYYLYHLHENKPTHFSHLRFSRKLQLTSPGDSYNNLNHEFMDNNRV